MTEPNPNKPAFCIAEWIYPLSTGCFNSLIAIGRNSSEDFKALRYLQNKKFKYTTGGIPQECKICPVMTASSDGQNT